MKTAGNGVYHGKPLVHATETTLFLLWQRKATTVTATREFFYVTGARRLSACSTHTLSWVVLVVSGARLASPMYDVRYGGHQCGVSDMGIRNRQV